MKGSLPSVLEIMMLSLKEGKVSLAVIPAVSNVCHTDLREGEINDNESLFIIQYSWVNQMI